MIEGSTSRPSMKSRQGGGAISDDSLHLGATARYPFTRMSFYDPMPVPSCLGFSRNSGKGRRHSQEGGPAGTSTLEGGWGEDQRKRADAWWWVGLVYTAAASGSARCRENHNFERVGMWASDFSPPNPSQRLKQKGAGYGAHPMTPRTGILADHGSQPARRMPSA